MADKPDSVTLDPNPVLPTLTDAVFDDNEQPTIVLDVTMLGEPDTASPARADRPELPDELLGMYYHG